MLQHVVSVLGHKAGDSILEFLSVLPEEVTEGRKISLSVRAVNGLLACLEMKGRLMSKVLSSNSFREY